MFYQFQTAADPATDRGIYLAGCCCSFTGGWIEGAVQTAINAASAVITVCAGRSPAAIRAMRCAAAIAMATDAASAATCPAPGSAGRSPCR
ncbi:FAD-dependent oxidoreductase [Burkholderia latens]|uniref:FAD-dependent oxidoreductase n=1 Tax=Burkholderia latens TaxID=488446 RepID=UPI003133113F